MAAHPVVVVEFARKSCVNCVWLAPAYAHMAGLMRGWKDGVPLAMADVDASPGLPLRYPIQHLPTFYVLEGNSTTKLTMNEGLNWINNRLPLSLRVKSSDQLPWGDVPQAEGLKRKMIFNS